jgi:hypothetical protein
LWTVPRAVLTVAALQRVLQQAELHIDSIAMGELTIITVNTNTKILVNQCLTSIYESAPSCEFEIIVIDNASRDGSCDAIQSQYPEVRLIQNSENVGFSVANNQGLSVANGRYLLLLNSDTVVPPGSLDRLIAAMEKDQSLGVVAPKLVYPDGSLQMSYGPIPNLFVAFCTFFGVKRLFPVSTRRKIANSRFVKASGRSGAGYLTWFSGRQPETKLVDKDTYVTGACMLIRRECYMQVGGLDPKFFMYVDDADYSLRVHQKGWKIMYLADSTVVHIKGGTVGEGYRWTSAPAYQSMLYFLKKHRGRWAFHLSKGFAVAAVFGRWLASVSRSGAERKRSWDLLAKIASYREPNP